ncbi:MAG: DUF92 domain-containing protein [Candidatus Aenigmatarchaeota archaeon]
MILLEALLGCSIVALISWKVDILSAPASIIAFLMGAGIWTLNGSQGLFWVLLLLIFMGIGYLGTKWKIGLKKDMNVEESNTGRRDLKNILGNGVSPTFFAVLSNPLAFSGAVSTAMADTLASEIGVTSDKAWLITTRERVVPGTEGAISLLGTLSSLLGSGTIAILSYFIFGVNPLATFLAGFLGCQIDSILGALFERDGSLTKSQVNLIATFSGGLLAMLIVFL